MLGSLWSRLKGFAPLFFIAMGLLSWRITAPYGWLAPWIISAMLFFAVLNMPPSAAAPRPKHLLLFVLQIAIGGTLYFILSAWDHVIAVARRVPGIAAWAAMMAAGLTRAISAATTSRW